MLVSLITKAKYQTLQLPEWKDGHFLITDPNSGEELFDIIGNGKDWLLKPCGDNQIQDHAGEVLENGQLIRVRIGDALDSALLYVEDGARHYAKYARCPVGDNESFTIGTDKNADILLNSPVISGKHCVLTCRSRRWSVQALDNRMGVFVNGMRTSQANLQPGDTVSIMNQKFIVLPGILAMNVQNVDVELFRSRMKRLKFDPVPTEKLLGKKTAPEFFHREPRFTNGLFEKDINVVAPPNPIAQSSGKAPDSHGGDSDGLLTYAPAVASGLMTVLGGVANPVAGLGMLVSSLFIPYLRNQKRREADQIRKKEYEQRLEEEAQEEEKRRQLYTQYLDKLDRELDELNQKQTQQLLKFNPRPDHEAEKLLSDKSALWNRRPEHSDFLDIRLGTGNLPVKANINFPDEAYLGEDDPMRESLRIVQEKERLLKGVPIMLQLSRFYSVGVSGAPNLTESMIARMMLQLSMHIGYDDLKICILGKLPAALRRLRWLPHTWNDERTVHMVAEDKEELTRLLPALDAELREHRTQGRAGEMNLSTRTMIFLIIDETLAGSGMVMRLLFDQPYERVHVISTATHSRNLPRRTDLAIGLRSGVGRMLWQEGNGRQTADFTLDPSVMSAIGPMVDIMANTRLDLRQEMSRMPDVVPFLDMFGVQDIARLNIMSRWLRSNPIHSLAAPIGISEDGNLCILDLHEKGDGPHGLIAGTTGSGKSEMLMNYILSMAVNYSPLELSFVLIDYKGGGMAKAFEALPHTAGIITNLDGNEINRSLQSIESELERRQRIFSECQKKIRNIDIYKYQQLYREKQVSEPLSHLVIITDEFAELKTQQPEFLQQLIRTARIGRSLGVHLILATQKPAGSVDPEIWSNSNFHISLRVQTPEDSREILKCEDAAHLTRVGSMFKQVGYGEVLVKAQSGWTGADYAPDSVNLPDCGVDVLNHMGSVIRHEDVAIGGKSSSSQLDAVIDYIKNLGKVSMMSARKLWEPVLEKDISLAALRKKYGVQDDPGVLNPILGEADNPARQCRNLVRLDLSSGRNTIIYGSAGSGKVMALTTVLEDLLIHHNADEMQIYILDCADDGLAIYRDAPQVGDVIGSDEEEKIQRLLVMLEEQIRIRKKRLSGAAMGESLNQRLAKAGLGNTLVIIHHIIAFQSLTENIEQQFKKVMMEGPHYGITFLATQESANGLRFQYSQQFPQKYTLQLDSDDDYPAILGRTEGFKPMAAKGRGMFRSDRLYEFQTASADRNPRNLCAEISSGWNGRRAEPIRVLPDQLMSADLESLLRPETPWRIPVALSTRSIRPEYFDLGSRHLHLALGDPQNIAQTFNGIAALACKNGIRVIALDANDLMDPIPGGENVNASALDDKATAMLHHCQAIFTRLNNGETVAPGAPTLYLIPDIRAVLNSMSNDGQEALEALMAGIRDIWGWRFIVGGSSETMQSQQFTKWFENSASRANGMYLGRGFADNGILNFQSVLLENIDYPMGYIIRDTAPIKVQFLQESEKGDWDEWNG